MLSGHPCSLMVIFTARHYASTVYAVIVCLSVCVSVSVTLLYCLKTAKREMM